MRKEKRLPPPAEAGGSRRKILMDKKIMRIAIACDHAGYVMKEYLVKFISEKGHEVIDLGVDSAETRSDYAAAAQVVGKAVSAGEAERGVLICGSGVGASIAANKMKGVYAAICHDTYSAAQGVQHDNMNVLCLGGRVIGEITAENLVDAFLSATFNTDVERYVRRFKMVQDME